VCRSAFDESERRAERGAPTSWDSHESRAQEENPHDQTAGAILLRYVSAITAFAAMVLESMP
jgi:hypothetical protein